MQEGCRLGKGHWKEAMGSCIAQKVRRGVVRRSQSLPRELDEKKAQKTMAEERTMIPVASDVCPKAIEHGHNMLALQDAAFEGWAERVAAEDSKVWIRCANCRGKARDPGRVTDVILPRVSKGGEEGGTGTYNIVKVCNGDLVFVVVFLSHGS